MSHSDEPKDARTKPTKRQLEQFKARLPTDLVGKSTGRVVVIEFSAMGSTPPRTVNTRLGRTHVRFSLGTTDMHVADQRTAHVWSHLHKLYDVGVGTVAAIRSELVAPGELA